MATKDEGKFWSLKTAILKYFIHCESFLALSCILWLFTVDQCCNCTKPTPASMWCGDCNGCYCPTCSQSLHQIVALAKHRPMPLSTKPPDPILCSVHPDEKLKYWCSNHEIAICRDCLLFEHKDETYALIDKVAKDVSAKVSAYSSTLIPNIFSI